MLPLVIIFVQAVRLCLSANQYTLCSLLMKGQIPKRQTVQRLRICVYVYVHMYINFKQTQTLFDS